MSKDRLRQILVDLIIVSRKKVEFGNQSGSRFIIVKRRELTLGGSERFYNIGYTENTISPRGSKTYILNRKNWRNHLTTKVKCVII